MPVAALTQVHGWSWGQLLPGSAQPTAALPADAEQAEILARENAPNSLTAWQKLLVRTSAVFMERPIEPHDVNDSAVQVQQEKESTSLPQLVLLSLLLCIAFGLIRLIAGYWQIRGLRNSAKPITDTALHQELASCNRRLGISGNIPIGEIETLGSAAVIGWLQPLLLLPSNWRA